ncbi:hypothetical protein ACTJN7_25230 [Citrobacter freundii]|uniref:hypothetical protein n=1 Tax=Citrobacter freundii TaxID=546 RepID=UPI003F8B01EE
MTTKVKVKKTRAERKQHSRDMQAKHEAEKKAANLRNILKRDILATLGIPKNHGGRAALSTFITEHLLKGESQVQIVAMLTGSELMKRAQLAEIERLKKITELANQTRRNEITNRAFERLGITTRHPMGDLVLSMVRELANQNLNTGEIVERLNDNETVLESRRLHKEKRADLERQIEKVLPSAKRPVLICGKCSPTWPRRTVQRIRLPQTPGDLLNIRMAIHRPGIMEKSERAV